MPTPKISDVVSIEKNRRGTPCPCGRQVIAGALDTQCPACTTELIHESKRQATLTTFPLTDLGNAERFEWRFGGEFACTDATGWMVYRDGVWREDRDGAADRSVHETVRLIHEESELVDTGHAKSTEAMQDAIIGWAKKSESNSKIKAALELASRLSGFARDYSKFDQKPHLFNCKNGTIDLKAGKFVPHSPADLLTKQSPITYEPIAKCPKWERFVLEIMGGKVHMVEYLQRCCGYTLTADTSGQCFFMPWGIGGTGKTTFLTVMRRIMGDYCKQADAELFMVKRGDGGQPFEMAGMEGVRLLMAIETEEGKKLALAKLKRMTGQDPITACRKFQNQYSFEPHWKIWLATNDAPTTRADDDAFWDRAKPIPFEVKFRGTDKEIKDYADALVKEEGSGILNWMIAGMKQWQKTGLAHPQDVAKAADTWRDRDDWLQRFLDENTEKTDERQKMVKKSDLFNAFTMWSVAAREGRNITEKQFSEAMKRKGYEPHEVKQGGKTVRVWIGLHLPSFVERRIAEPDPKDFEV
jgi:putative DNA primase/helicase